MSSPYTTEPAPNAARIRELNDALRTCTDPIGALSMNGSIIFTRAVVMRGQAFVNQVFAAVAAFLHYS